MAEKQRWQCVKACTWSKKYWPVWSVYEGTETPPAQHFTLLGPATDTGTGTEGGGGCKCVFATEGEVRALCNDVLGTGK